MAGMHQIEVVGRFIYISISNIRQMGVKFGGLSGQNYTLSSIYLLLAIEGIEAVSNSTQ